MEIFYKSLRAMEVLYGFNFQSFKNNSKNDNN